MTGDDCSHRDRYKRPRGETCEAEGACVWGLSGSRPVALQNPSEHFAERCAEYCVAAPQVRAKNPNIKRVFEIAKRAYAEFVKTPRPR